MTPQSSHQLREKTLNNTGGTESPCFQFGPEPMKETDEPPIAMVATAKPLTLARSRRSLAPVSLAHNSAPLRRSTKLKTVEVK